MTKQAELTKKGRKTTPKMKHILMLKKAEILRPIVEAIRSCAAAGMPPKKLKEKFGYSGSVISNIVHNHTYTYEYAKKKTA